MEIEPKYRTFWPRFWAALLDTAALSPIVWLEQLIWNNTTSTFTLGTCALLTQVIYVFYYIVFLYKYGQTPGQMAMGVLVLDHKNQRLSFNQAILRNIVLVLLAPITLVTVYGNLANGNTANRGLGDFESMSMLWIGVVMIIWGVLEMITMLFNKKRRAVHDYIAGTVVVRQPIETRLNSFKHIKYGLIVLFIADLIVPKVLPENNMSVEGFDSRASDKSFERDEE